MGGSQSSGHQDANNDSFCNNNNGDSGYPPYNPPPYTEAIASEDAPPPRSCHVTKWPEFQGYGFNLKSNRELKLQEIGLLKVRYFEASSVLVHNFE